MTNDLDRIALERMIVRNQAILDSHAKGIALPLIVSISGLSEDYVLALIDKAGVKPFAEPETAQVIPFTRVSHNSERNRLICEAYLAGQRVKDIGPLHGIQPGTVYTILSRYNAIRTERANRGCAPDKFSDRNFELCELYKSGKTLAEVGAHYNITQERVRQVLVKNGVEERFNGFYKPERIEARQRFMANKQVNEDRANDRAAKVNAARAMYDNGSKYHEIAAAMGHTIGWVQMVIWKTGGPSRNPSARRPRLRMTTQQREEIGRRYAANDRIEDIAKDFGIVPKCVSIMANQAGFYRPGFGPGVSVCNLRKKENSAEY